MPKFEVLFQNDMIQQVEAEYFNITADGNLIFCIRYSKKHPIFEYETVLAINKYEWKVVQKIEEEDAQLS